MDLKVDEIESNLVSELLRITRNHTIEQMERDLEALGYQIYSEQRYQFKKAPIFIIRPGFSDYNYCMEKVKTSDRATRSLVQTDINLMDSNLHQAGLIQLQVKSEHLKSYDFDFVFVSPLKTALQTAWNLFSLHPNKSLMKFIVIPHLCEQLGTSCEFQLGTVEVIQEFLLSFQESSMSLDFTFLTQMMEKSTIKEFWQLEVVQNQEKIDNFIESYKQAFTKHNEVTMNEKQQFLVNLQRQNLSEGILESPVDAFNRAKVAKQIISDYLKSLLRHRVDNEFTKIAIISHQIIIQQITGGSGSSKSFNLRNAEAAPFQWEDLEN